MKQKVLAVNTELNKSFVENVDFRFKQVRKEINNNDGTVFYQHNVEVGIAVKINAAYITNDASIKNFLQSASPYVSNDKTAKDFFVDKTLYIPFAATFIQRAVTIDGTTSPAEGIALVLNETDKFTFNTEAVDVKFLAYCKSMSLQTEEPNADARARLS